MIWQEQIQQARIATTPQQAINSYLLALKFMELEFGSQDLRLSEIMSVLAGLYFELGDYQKAIEYDSKSLEILKIFTGKDSTTCAQVINNLAISYWRLGDHNAANNFFQQAIVSLHNTDKHELKQRVFSDFKQFCYRTQNYEQLCELAKSKNIDPYIYTFLKDNMPVIFANNGIFCCSETNFAPKLTAPIPLGKVIYFQLIPLAAQNKTGILFDREDKNGILLQEFSKEFQH